MKTVWLLCLLACFACTRSQSFSPEGFAERSYELWLPEASSAKPFGLVVLLHAYATTPATQESFFRIRAELRKAGIAYAWPMGLSNRSGQLFWNANPSCCDNDGQAPDDVAYVLAVIDDIAARIPLDKNRVALLGVSNGAFMAYQLACEKPERFSKLVAVSGAPPASCPALSSSGPSILHVHGDNDALVPLEGGKLGPAGQSFPSSSAMMEQWATEGECQPLDAGNPPALFRQPVVQKAWVCPQQRRHLTLWVVGGGHQLPPTNAFSWAVLHFLNAP